SRGDQSQCSKVGEGICFLHAISLLIRIRALLAPHSLARTTPPGGAAVKASQKLRSGRGDLAAVVNSVTRFRDKFKGKAIYAIAQPVRRRAVFKHRPQMPAAAAAVHFGSLHPQPSV